MSIYFIKMNNGEEIIADLNRHKDFYTLVEPMTIEYGETEGRRLVFMARYNPYMSDKTIRMPKSSVAFMGKVTPEVAEYYESSVLYCREVMDETFRKGMRSASQYCMEQVQEDKMDLEAERKAPEQATMVEITGTQSNTTYH